jgi:hypothetical protein
MRVLCYNEFFSRNKNLDTTFHQRGVVSLPPKFLPFLISCLSIGIFFFKKNLHSEIQKTHSQPIRERLRQYSFCQLGIMLKSE